MNFTYKTDFVNTIRRACDPMYIGAYFLEGNAADLYSKLYFTQGAIERWLLNVE